MGALLNNYFFKRFLGVGVLAGGMLLGASHAQASDIYISQSGSGAANGADCADAFSTSFFNTGSNWGSGGNQIGPGTIVHLCGTVSGGSGATGLTFHAGGSSGRPITLLFEDGARLTSPQWNAAIFSNNNNWITIDGGNSGIIENTSAGSSGASCSSGSCSIHDPTSYGVNITGGSNIEVKNLTVQNIYIHSGTGSDGVNTKGIYFPVANSSQSAITVHDNTVHDAQSGIIFGFNNISNIQVYNNTTYNHTWGVAFLDDNNGSSATTVSVYNNDISGFENWRGPNGGDNGFHQDGVFFAATNPSTSFTNSSIYNNYLHGAMTNPSTGHIYLTGSGGGMRNNAIYNNLIVAPQNDLGHTGEDEEGLIVLGFGSLSTSVYNNTFVSQDPGIDIRDNGTTVAAVKNNIFMGDSGGPMYTAILDKNQANLKGLVNNNDYYNIASGHTFQIGDGTNNYGSLSSWQSACGCDSSSVMGNPNLDGTYHPQSPSPAIGLGSVLTTLNLLTLDVDKVGTPRLLSWDAGAYQSGATASSTPPPAPTGLKAQVQ